jgi:hypothetical protein
VYLSTWLLICLALLGAAVCSALFFPGLMSFDSLDQYRQAARIAPLNDQHPVIMALVWRGLMKVFPSPGSLLILQQFAYWAGAALIAWAAIDGVGRRLLLFFVVALWPPLIIHSLHLWKDAGMAIALILALGALLADIKRPHFGWLCLAAVMLLYGFAVRYNALFGVAPLLILLGWRVAGRFQRLPIIRGTLVLSAVTFGIYLTVAMALNSGVEKGPGFSSLALWDMAAISIRAGEDLLPPHEPWPHGAPPIEQLKAHFRQEVNVPTLAALPRLKPTYDRGLIFQDWLDLIWCYPAEYLRHRTAVFTTLMGLGVEKIYYPFNAGILPNDLGITLKFLTLDQRWNWIATFNAIADWPLYRPWPYALISVAIVAILCLRPIQGHRLSDFQLAALFVASSGLAMTLPLFVLAPATDYRYVVWLIAATVIATILLAADWGRPSPEEATLQIALT